MKLTKTGWNNVIIFSVMAIIILINATNDKLFSQDERNSSEQAILPEHSVILTLAIDYLDDKHVLFERVGREWQVTSKNIEVQQSNNQIEQMIFAWQQSNGLVQADEIIVEADVGIHVNIALAGENKTRTFIVYPLADQLLINKQLENSWLALPAPIAQQLLPVTL